MPAGAVILARMPHTLKDALDAYAATHDMPVTEVIRQACAALVGYPYTQPHGNTIHSNLEAKRRARNIKQRERASQRRALIRRLNTHGETNARAG